MKLFGGNAVLCFILIFGICSSTLSTVIRVPLDRTTIQGGIDLSVSGDTVLVADGTYRGGGNRDIDLHGKSIVVRSVNGPLSTIIDLQNAGTAFYVRSGEKRGTVIEGFTCRNASNSYGAGMAIHASFPTIKNCRFENCRARDGGAVWADFADSVEFIDCVFKADSALGMGGAIYIGGNPVTFTRCVFVQNKANEGAGLYQGGVARVNQCVFIDNRAKSGGSAIFRRGSLNISNSIIAFNPVGIPVANEWPGMTYYACTDMFGNAVDNWVGSDSVFRGSFGNLSVNPLFCDTASGNYAVRFYSPCAPANNSCGTTIGALDQSMCDWVLPDPSSLHLSNESPYRVVNHTPSFQWSSFDTTGTQQAFEIQVGTDNDWYLAESWLSGAVNSTDSVVPYAGLPLQNGAKYFYRIRLNNGSNWGSWSQGSFAMNSAPTTPLPTWPVNDGPIQLSAVKLAIHNSTDQQSDKLTYYFEVYADTTSSNPFQTLSKLSDASDSTVSGMVNGLTAGSRYWWRVRAFDQYEYSPWSSFNTFIPRSAVGVIRVPQDAPTIQRGIAAGNRGDTILVSPGTYVENVSFAGRPVLLLSSAGPGSTFIHPRNDTLPIVSFPTGYDTVGIIDGFTLEGTTNAPGIYSSAITPTIRHCTIRNCHRNGDGGGIYIGEYGNARILNCTLYNNSSGRWGGAIGGVYSSSNSIIGNTIYNNHAPQGPGIGLGGANVLFNVVYNNTDTGRYAAGILVNCGVSVIRNNTVVGNSNGIIFLDGCSSYAQIDNNIVVNNLKNGIVKKDATYPQYNNVWHNGIADSIPSIQGISVDPLFVDTASHNYALSSESPCIDRGRPDAAFNDPDGSRNDMGAIPFAHALPAADKLTLGLEAIERVVSATPVFHWTYHDSVASTQHAFEIQVSDSLVSFTPNKWSPGVITGADSSITYAGSELLDGLTYYYRIRLNDGTDWGSWTYSHFRMNILPGVPTPKTPTGDKTVFAGAVQLVVDSSANPDSDTMRYDFQIFEKNLPKGDPIQTLDTQGNVYSRYFNPLPLNHRYWWRARAYDGYERSDWSDMATFITRGNTTIRVPSEYATIQDAITAASTHDTVLVTPGTYTGDGNRDLRFLEKSVFLLSSGGAATTIIDCQGSANTPHRAMFLPAWRDTAALVRGFTFQNGYADYGGVISGRYATANFADCVFRNNHAIYGGVCSAIDNPFSPSFVNCVFHHNVAEQEGGAVRYADQPFVRCTFYSNSALYGGAAYACGEMDSCIIYDNHAHGGSALYAGGSAKYSLFARNGSSGEGACLANAPGPYINCTFYGNLSVIALSPQLYGRFTNCLLAYNRVSVADCDGGTPPHDPPRAVVTLDHCNVFGNVYTYAGCIGNQAGISGNISVDPGFCDTTGLSFTLANNSHCLNAGTGGANIGAFGASCGPMGVDDDDNQLPKSFSLSPNYPNPFNPSTVIEYAVPTRSPVSLSILNLLGQQIRTLVDADQPAGTYKTIWDGTDSRGKSVASGIYFYRLESGTTVLSRKMLLLK